MCLLNYIHLNIRLFFMHPDNIRAESIDGFYFLFLSLVKRYFLQNKKTLLIKIIRTKEINQTSSLNLLILTET